jgi:hypothetical protein
MIELVQRVQDTQVFLRMAAIELRRIADAIPGAAIELRQMAQKLEAEAEDLARDSKSGLIPAPHEPTSTANSP